MVGSREVIGQLLIFAIRIVRSSVLCQFSSAQCVYTRDTGSVSIKFVHKEMKKFLMHFAPKIYELLLLLVRVKCRKLPRQPICDDPIQPKRNTIQISLAFDVDCHIGSMYSCLSLLFYLSFNYLFIYRIL